MHKKQAKTQNKNKVGIHKNVPLSIQISHEEYEEFVNSHLEIKSYDELMEIFNEDEDDFDCDCRISEDMLFDCLIEEDNTENGKEEDKLNDKSKKTSEDSLSLFDALKDFEKEGSKDGCVFLHSDKFNEVFELYKKQKEINRRNRRILQEAILEPLRYFGKVELLRDIDTTLETIFKKKKYKKVKKGGNKIFERGQKPVDNSAAEEIVSRRKEFKEVFPDLDFPILKDVLLEENVKADKLIEEEEGFKKY